MALKTLVTKLQPLENGRLKVLQTKAGSTERIRGRKWMATRDRVALAHGYRCAGCGNAWHPRRDQIDHKVGLEQGGSNDDENLQPLCDECHKAKTAGESKRRAGT